MTGDPKRNGGWPGPRKPVWNFRPDPATEPAVRRYMARHGLDWDRRGDRSKAINAMLTTHPDARTEGT